MELLDVRPPALLIGDRLYTDDLNRVSSCTMTGAHVTVYGHRE